MKAVVKLKRGEGFIEVKEVPEPKVKNAEVLIEVKAVGVCGSDIKIWHDKHPYFPPVILGHEFAGEIVQLGKEVQDWKVGDRVVGELHVGACRKCKLCRSGKVHLCPQKKALGWGTDGAFAKYTVIPNWLLHRLPENVSYQEGTLIEPLAVVIQGLVEKSGIGIGDFVVVFGPGPLGLLAAQVAKTLGASEVMIVGTSGDEFRLKIAKELDIDHIVNSAKNNVVSEIMKLTNGKGADIVVELSGGERAIQQAFQIVAKAGKIVAIGILGKGDIEIPWQKLVFSSSDILFSVSSQYTSWEKAVALVSTKKIKVKPLITHQMKLEEWHNAFIAVENRESVKSILLP